MDTEYAAKPDRELTLLERIANLEAHHEETRKRMHQMETRLGRNRERIDRILGSEPEVAPEPDYNRSGR